MSYARIGILAALLFALGISLYFFYNLLETSEGVNSAVAYFEEGEYKESVLELNQYRDEMSSAQYQLYLAYISRARNEIIESSLLLAKAEEISDPKKKPEVLMEIYLNQALNAFIARDSQGIDEALAKARKLTKVNQEWIPIFEGIKDYLNHQCADVEKNWQKPIPQVYFSPFMQAVFSKQFTSAWVKGHMARCEIESGNYLNVRQGLESGQQSDEAEYHFLNAITYMKEAAGKSSKGAIPYYKIAFSYLNKVPETDVRYHLDRQQIMSEIGERALQLIRENSFQDLGFYAEILEKGKASGELNEISKALAQELNKQIDANNWTQVGQIVDLLSQSIGKGDMRDKLRQRFEMLLNNALDNADFSHVEFYWKTVRSFADDPNQLSDQFADMAAAKILVMIPFDDNKLTATEPYFAFWKTVEKDHIKRLQFANELLQVSQHLWNAENQEQKAIAVMKEAYSIPAAPDQKAFYAKLEDMLGALWKKAADADVVDQYPYYLQAVNHFGFTQVNVLDPQEAAQQLVDAEYMFRNGRYADAKKRALWALQVDPSNQRAKRIAGLSDYFFGSYKSALSKLKDIPHDPEVDKALAISELLTGQDSHGIELLHQLENKGEITGSDYLRIGFGLLLINQPEASLTWFDKATQPGDSAQRAGLMYANFALKAYPKVIADFGSLEPPYSRLDGLQIITIESLIAQNQLSEAEEMLLNLLKRGPQPETREFPLYFQRFKEEKLDSLNRYYAAAKFYSVIRKNYPRAVSYFQQIQNPAPEILLDYAQALKNNGNFSEAHAILENLSANQELSPDIQKLVFLNLARTYQSMRDWIRAVESYQKYLQRAPQDSKQRVEYAKALVAIRRYDLAYQQLQASKESDPLVMIDLLLHIGKYADAVKEANAWLQRSPDLTEQLQLATLFLKVNDSDISQQILKQIKDPSKLTIDQKEALIDYWTEKGDFSKAQELIRSNRPALQKRVSGLLTLANFSSKTSSMSEAMDYALKAAEMDPKNVEVKEFIDNNRIPIGTLVNDANDPSNQLSNAKALLRAADALLAGKKISQLHTSLEVQQASNWLSELSRMYPQLPEIWYYYGVSLLQLRRFTDAETALNNAIRLDPSYASANSVLAEVYAAQNDLNKAVNQARLALKLDPYSSQAWETMATIQEQQGMLLDAAQGYQNAITFKPNNLSALIKYGKIRLKASDPEKAIESFEKALVYAPNDINLIKLTIVTYNDSDLRRDRSKEQLKSKQQALYKKLESLDPKEAEAVKSDLIK